MGEVWRAFDETLGRPIAVKLLLPHDPAVNLRPTGHPLAVSTAGDMRPKEDVTAQVRDGSQANTPSAV